MEETSQDIERDRGLRSWDRVFSAASSDFAYFISPGSVLDGRFYQLNCSELWNGNSTRRESKRLFYTLKRLIWASVQIPQTEAAFRENGFI